MIRIFKVFVPTSILALFLSECILISSCYVASDYFAGDGTIFLVYDSWLHIGLVVCLILLGLYFASFYDGARIVSRLLLFQKLCYVVGFSFIVEALVGYWAADFVVPLGTMIVGSLFTLFGLFGWRLLFNIAIQNAVGARRVLFLGLSPTVLQLAAHMREHPEVGLVPIGYVDKQNTSGVTTSDPTLVRLGSVSDLTYVIDDVQPHWIVIGNRAEIHSRSIDEILNLRFGGIQAEDAATLYETTCGRVCASELRPSELLFSDRLQPGSPNLNLQTIYSTGFALAAVIVTLPLMVLMVALLKTSSNEPVLLREQRVGLRGVPFTMYRFQWMSNKEGIKCATSIGKLVRRFRLDALPELFNVLRGEMSVVGPLADRPDFANRLNQLIPFYQQRHMSRVTILQSNPLLEQCTDDAFEAVAGLQLAQPRGVGRGYVDRDVVGMWIDLLQTRNVVGLGILDRRVGIFSDADAADSPIAALRQPREEMVDAFVVESHAVHQCFAGRNSEHARLWIPALRPRRHGAEFDMAETHCAQCIEIIAVLVEAGCESERVGKLQSETPHREAGGHFIGRPQRPQQSQCGQTPIMRTLRIDARQQGQRPACDDRGCEFSQAHGVLFQMYFHAANAPR